MRTALDRCRFLERGNPHSAYSKTKRWAGLLKRPYKNKVKHPCNSDNSGTVCISARTTRTSKTVRFPYRQGLHHKKGETLQPDYLTRRWNKFVKQHGLRPVRLHDLRHTTASLMLMNGTDVKVLAEILGHKDVAVTLNTYSHVASEQKRNALITLGALCGR